MSLSRARQRVTDLPGQIVINVSTVPQGGDVNWNDIGYKVFWTVVASIAGLVPVVAADLPAWLAPPLIGLANLLLAYARQKVEAKRAATTAAALLAVLALAAGVTVATAAPAAAHHTHNAYTLCSQTNPTSYPISWAGTVVFRSDGHPLWARCQVRAAFAVYYCWRVSYDTHSRGSLYRC